MRGRGKAIGIVSILALLVGIAVGGVSALADQGQNQKVVPSGNPVPITFPGFHNESGPFIMAATFRPSTLAATGGQDEVYVVFNEPIDPATVDLTPGDPAMSGNPTFVATGFNFTTVAVAAGNRAVRLRLDPQGSTPAGNATVRLRDMGEVSTVAVVGPPAVPAEASTQLSDVPVGTGPVVVSAVFADAAGARADQDPDNTSIVLTFDAPVAYAAGQTATTAFSVNAGTPLTPEFNEATLTGTIASDQITITRSSGNSFLRFLPGVSKAWVRNGTITWTAPTTANSALYKVEVGIKAPRLLAAYYNDLGDGGGNNDLLWLVFSDPVNIPQAGVVADAATGALLLDADADVLPAIAGGQWPTASPIAEAVLSPAFDGETSILRATTFAGNDAVPNDNDYVAVNLNAVDPNLLADYQGLLPDAADTTRVQIHYGPGIIRATYDAGPTTTTYGDDRLYIWLSEAPDPADSLRADEFTFDAASGMTSDGLEIESKGSINSIYTVVIRGFTADNHWTPGAMITFVAVQRVVGADSGQPYATRLLPIYDETRPYATVLTPVGTGLDRAAWNHEADRGDSLFFAFQKTDGTDSDQYHYLVLGDPQYYSPAIPTDLDGFVTGNVRLAHPLNMIHPDGNPEITKFGLLVQPLTYNPATPTMTDDGVALDLDTPFYILVMSADFQGNLALPSDRSVGYESSVMLGPFSAQGEPGLWRVYAQPPVCPALEGPPTEATPDPAPVFNSVGLFALQEQLNHEVQAVKFEYWVKTDDDLCPTHADSIAGSTWTEVNGAGLGTDQALNSPSGEPPVPPQAYWGPGGDLVLYRSTTPGVTPDDLTRLVPGTQGGLLVHEGADPVGYWYWDVNLNNRYDPLDAVIWNGSGLASYDGTNQTVVIGSAPPVGTQMKMFDIYEYWAQSFEDETSIDPVLQKLDPTDWILRQNPLNFAGEDPIPDPPDSVNLWYTALDVSTLPANTTRLLVRARAQDEAGNWDTPTRLCATQYDNDPMEVQLLTIGTITTPSATDLTVTAFFPDTLMAGIDSLTMTTGNPMTFPGRTLYVKVSASSADADHMVFAVDPLTLPAGVTPRLGVNNGQWYANLDNVPGYQENTAADPAMDDEVFLDVDHNGMFNQAIDQVVSAGRNGIVDTPEGTYLLPLVADGTNPTPAITAPFVVYWDLTWNGDTVTPQRLFFPTDTNVTFGATPTLGGQPCPNPPDVTGAPITLTPTFYENAQPMALVRNAEMRTDGAFAGQLDIWPIESDGTPYGAFGADVDTLNVFVTARDSLAQVQTVRLFYRQDPACTAPPASGWTFLASLPRQPHYQFDWHVGDGTLPDGSYQFYAQALDAKGNFSAPPGELPANVPFYGFSKHAGFGTQFAHIVLPAAPNDTTLAPGDFLRLRAVPDDPDNVAFVHFFVAPRYDRELVLTSEISTSAPYQSAPLNFAAVMENAAGNGVLLTTDGDTLSYGTDYTIESAGGHSVIQFAALPTVDTLYVSYNVGNYEHVGVGDETAPYTVDWTIPESDELPTGSNGLPANAFDLVAVAYYLPPGVTDVACSYPGSPVVTGNPPTTLFLRESLRPMVVLYGLTRRPDLAAYPDMNRPGNPLFQSIAGNVENKLSGIETDVFVRALPATGRAITSVTASLTTDKDTEWSFTKYEFVPLQANTIDIPITFYVSDYPQFTPTGIETISLVMDGGTPTAMTQSATDPDAYEVMVPLSYMEAGISAHSYTFTVDMIGDTHYQVADARNNNGAGLSEIIIPQAPFWYRHIDDTAADSGFDPTRRHTVVVTATDNMGDTGTNMNADIPAGEVGYDAGNPQPQGPIQFLWDNTPPTVSNIEVTRSVIGWSAPAPLNSTDVLVTAHDDPVMDPNVVTIKSVQLQYLVNNPNPNDPYYFPMWMDANIVPNPDPDQADGWVFRGFRPALPPDADHIDNNGNGEIDEPAEATFAYTLRAIAVDDGENHGYYTGPAVTVTVDNEPPEVMLQPLDNITHDYNDTVTLGAVEVNPPEVSDIAHVKFQWNDGHFGWIDNAADPRNHAGLYDVGIDAVFADTNGNGVYDDGEPAVITPTDFVFADHIGEGSAWFDIDPTPNDLTDFPWVTTAVGGVWSVDFHYPLAAFYGDANPPDTYVHLRAIAADMAGNEQSDPVPTLLILNDTTGPAAYITSLVVPGLDPIVIDPSVTARLHGMVAVRGSYQPTGAGSTAYVSLYYKVGEEGTPVLIQVANSEPTGLNPNGTFSINWDTDDPAIVEGTTYILYAQAADADGNLQETPLEIEVVVDRTGPVVTYDNFVVWPNGTVATAEYQNDQVVDHSSLVIVPDPVTGDVVFQVVTEDTDISSMQLQYALPTDPEGMWRDWTIQGGEFTYQPNIGPGVWRFAVDNFPEALEDASFPSTRNVRFRVLAMDQAGNTNSNSDEMAVLTIDRDPSCLWNWTSSASGTGDRVTAGETVTFQISVKDEDMLNNPPQGGCAAVGTDVVDVVLEVAHSGAVDWTAVPSENGLQPEQIDTANAMWLATRTWTAPDFVTHNTDYVFRAHVFDSAGNDTYVAMEGLVVTVVDQTPPVNTKITGVAGLVYYANDPDDGHDLPAGGYDPNCPECNDYAWIDMNGDAIYDAGDFVLSTGEVGDSSGNAIPLGRLGTPYGALTNTWPQNVTESFLGQNGAVLKVNNQVTVVARTQGGDDGYSDNGIANVEFYARNAAGDDILIGKDETPPGFPLYLWQTGWDVTATDANGNPLFPEGTYTLWARAIDQAGNIEEDMNLTTATIEVDTTAPVATMDADPQQGGIQAGPIDVERNSAFTLYAVTDPANEADTVTFWMKRQRDLNAAGSYSLIPNAAGVDPEDVNPDMNRPYSMDVNMGLIPDLTDPNGTTPLHVGETYEFVASVTDEVGNETSQVADREAGRQITVHIVDTMAPQLAFVEARRSLQDGDLGDGAVIPNPTAVHARAFAYLKARLQTPSLDLDHVIFEYKLDTEPNTWTISDIPVTRNEDGTWQLGAWDLRALQHNVWYDVAVLGVDDVGNTDVPDMERNVMKVFVDYEAPVVTLEHPSATRSHWCDYHYVEGTPEKTEGITGHRWLDLILQRSNGPTGTNDDIFDINWQWKPSAADPLDPDSWSSDGVALDGLGRVEVIDGATMSFQNSLDLSELPGSGLYDLRVIVMDVSGNADTLMVGRNTVDMTDPGPVQVSMFKLNGTATPPPIGDGDFLAIKAGTVVEIDGTASDDEPELPNETIQPADPTYETYVKALQFQVMQLDGDWHDIGTVQLTPAPGTDPINQVGSVTWNTSGLGEGTYFVRVGAQDECGNPVTGDFTWSAPVMIQVTDQTPPIARIVAWNPDMQLHGENPPTTLTVWALAESDASLTYDVQFQYNEVGADTTSPDNGWVNFGVGEMASGADHTTTEQLWFSTIDPTNFSDGVTSVWLRALVKDEQGNRYGDNPDDVVPAVRVSLVHMPDGANTFAAIRAPETVVNDLSVQVEATDPHQLNLTVHMAVQDQTPRVVVVARPNTPGSASTIINVSPGTPNGLVRSVDDPLTWRGEAFPPEFHPEDCTLFTIWVSGLDGTAGSIRWIDLMNTSVPEYTVTTALGTNGVVKWPPMAAAWPPADLHAAQVEILPGAWQAGTTCLLMTPTMAPMLSTDERLYLTPVPNTAFHIELLNNTGAGFRTGLLPSATIYSAQALDSTKATVRRWAEGAGPNGGAWVSTGVSNIQAHAHSVSFNYQRLDSGDQGVVFEIFEATGNPPMMTTYWPYSPYVNDQSAFAWTNSAPYVVTTLRDMAGERIDPSAVELLIDGDIWASWYGNCNSFPCDATYQRGYEYYGGPTLKAYLDQANESGSVLELDYPHVPSPQFALTERLPNGQPQPHTLTVRYRTTNHDTDWQTHSFQFNVDDTPPSVIFDGGFVSNPRLGNVAGYMNPQDHTLQVKLYDGGSGILFKQIHPFYVEDLNGDGQVNIDEAGQLPEPGVSGDGDDIAIDLGLKYDLWWVHPKDQHQRDIDQFEERTLLHTGTADELAPWTTPSLEDYRPGDTLTVRVPILGGGRIQDGDVLEITWYSLKLIEQNSDGESYGCSFDTLMVGNQAILIRGADCSYDAESQEMHIYQKGPSDWAFNSGSRYVEQRFIVETSSPVCNITAPPSQLEPTASMPIDITVGDGGSGVRQVEVTVAGPGGCWRFPSSEDCTDLQNAGLTPDVNDPAVPPAGSVRFVGTIPGPLASGTYTVSVMTTDAIGNTGTCEKTVNVESAVLALTEAKPTPNPFNPDKGEVANIQFALSRHADVTARIYDFAGHEVRTLALNQPMGINGTPLQWGGEANDGTKLADGAYICRITATDGVRTERTTLKIVIWRE